MEFIDDSSTITVAGALRNIHVGNCIVDGQLEVDSGSIQQQATCAQIYSSSILFTPGTGPNDYKKMAIFNLNGFSKNMTGSTGSSNLQIQSTGAYKFDFNSRLISATGDSTLVMAWYKNTGAASGLPSIVGDVWSTGTQVFSSAIIGDLVPTDAISIYGYNSGGVITNFLNPVLQGYKLGN